jgi:hypothetical protein
MVANKSGTYGYSTKNVKGTIRIEDLDIFAIRLEYLK